MSKSTDPVRQASLGILRERYAEQDGQRKRHMSYAVYSNATPTPEDAHPTVHIVEQVLKDHSLAVAAFHAKEAARFRAALEELEDSE